MAIFSKPLAISPSCYELGHCWTPNCVAASTDVAKSVFKEAIKIYGTLYLVAAIVNKKDLRYYLKRYVPETLRSTVFLTINGTLFLTMFCLWRNTLGCIYFLTCSFGPAYVGAFIAVLFERKSRRGPLAVYLTNLAAETGYRMLVERRLFRPVANGEVYIFSAVSAIYFYLYRSNGLTPSLSSLFRFFVGPEENNGPGSTKTPSSSTLSSPFDAQTGDHARRKNNKNGKNIAEIEDQALSSSHNPAPTSSGESRPLGSRKSAGCEEEAPGHVLVLLVRRLSRVMREGHGHCMHLLESLARHECCPHQHSCLSYVLKGGSRMFTVGYVAQTAINLFSTLPTLVKHPSAIKSVLFSRLNLKLAAFLGAYSSIFKAVNCLLRWFRNKDSELHGAVAGALAGLSLRFYRSVTIALYAATKLVEILYFKGIKSYGFPYIKCADIFIYAFSTAFIFHAAVMEPHTLRPGYWKFLQRVTGNRISQMNRRLLDAFGVKSSKIAPDYWPNYDTNFSTLTRPKA